MGVWCEVIFMSNPTLELNCDSIGVVTINIVHVYTPSHIFLHFVI